MKANAKVKSIIASAILLIVCLLMVSIWQLVAINKKQRQLNAQQAEISRLNDKLKYYEDHTESGPSGDGSDITVEGEN